MARANNIHYDRRDICPLLAIFPSFPVLQINNGGVHGMPAGGHRHRGYRHLVGRLVQHVSFLRT